MQALEVVAPNMGVKPFAPQGEDSGFEFPSDCGTLCCGGFCGDILFLLPSLKWVFSHLLSV